MLYCPAAAAGPPRPVAAAGPPRGADVARPSLAKVQKFFNLNVESMTELVSELVTVEGAAHIHQNASNLVHLEDVAAAKLDSAFHPE